MRHVEEPYAAGFCSLTSKATFVRNFSQKRTNLNVPKGSGFGKMLQDKPEVEKPFAKADNIGLEEARKLREARGLPTEEKMYHENPTPPKKVNKFQLAFQFVSQKHARNFMTVVLCAITMSLSFKSYKQQQDHREALADRDYILDAASNEIEELLAQREQLLALLDEQEKAYKPNSKEAQTAVTIRQQIHHLLSVKQKKTVPDKELGGFVGLV